MSLEELRAEHEAELARLLAASNASESEAVRSLKQQAMKLRRQKHSLHADKVELLQDVGELQRLHDEALALAAAVAARPSAPHSR